MLKSVSMIVSLIKEVAESRKITNASRLASETGLHLAVAYSLWGNKQARIDFKTLDMLCVTLKCQPGQLLKFENSKKQRSS